jgi:hypothetical protein
MTDEKCVRCVIDGENRSPSGVVSNFEEIESKHITCDTQSEMVVILRWKQMRKYKLITRPLLLMNMSDVR